MSRICFLVDEDTPHSIRDGLLRRQPQIEIRVVGDDMAPSLNTPDADILCWLEREGYILISRNRSTMSQHLLEHLETGRHVPGILILRPRVSIGRIIEELLLIWETTYCNEYQDRIIYIPL